MREVDLVLLPRVPFQVVDVRDAVGQPGGGERVLLEQVALPLPPLHCLQTVALQAHDRVAAGLLCIAKQEVTHVHSVDLPVGWNLRSRRT